LAWPSNLGIENKAAKAYIERYFQRYPGVKRTWTKPRPQAKSMGYVETVFGRRLYLPEINSPTARAAPGRARRHQRAHAGHGGRPHQAGMVAVQQGAGRHSSAPPR
jgi:DNA polymerase-1